MKTFNKRLFYRLFLNISKIAILSSFYLLTSIFNIMAQEKDEKTLPNTKFKVIGNQPQKDLFKTYRRMVVGPWVHQPEEYEGYNGFVGWPGLTRLKSGRLLLTFSSGYWHASPPLTEEILKDEKVRKQFEEWYKIGIRYINAPRGGRAHIMYSDDNGKTWTDPQPLVDTELDDRHPRILELSNGTWLCTFFTYKFPRDAYAKYILSKDSGKTWSEPKDLPGNARAFSNGPAIQLYDGNILIVSDHIDPQTSKEGGIVILRSKDMGETFEVVTLIQKEYEQFEPTVTQLENGNLVMMTRPRGDIYWSNDLGNTWITTNTGVRMFEPHLILLPNRILANFHGGYDLTGDALKLGGLSVILSPDNGHTWHGPESVTDKEGGNMGYRVDPSVYGSNSNPIILPDGTIYTVYLNSGGHYPNDARTQALWSIRVQINESADGIKLLPSPGGADFQGGILFSESLSKNK